MRILLLGGTTEASMMARRLATTGLDAVFSYAGRTDAPVAQPLPVRVGGFGGAGGLGAYLHREKITHVIDATHPFAARMSQNASNACAAAQVPLIRLERPAWEPSDGDIWQLVPSVEAIPNTLPNAPARVFLAIGKQQVGLFAARPQHHYLLRLVDPPAAPLPLPHTTVVIARGPFDIAGDTALMQEHRITHVVAKNSGGSGARAKLDAARALGLPVLMADRPKLPEDRVARNADEVMRWLGHDADRGV
ncbi:Precorrin-6x reductase [Sulfitobacter noctilucae]|uniref:cobalt-precorrin-6A reductase n=1 Tax=Sulfitobacter noctilucae TaxID=1342302 RepID=UPI00046A49A4|nr:cobalt-precorrin-6A reductase [Sulfitobacter noctilucae]KIN75382.1 Precorrin-6x reductase [Sulfitobacter noctilucae]